LGILLLALGIRIFYFWITKNQTLWWDEAEYMLKSKMMAYQASWHDYWSPRKPILLAWLFVPFFKLNISEVVMRFVLALLSFLGVYSTYLVAKEFFDRKIGLIASFLMSVFWVHLFFTGRFLVEMPATPFFLLSLYFFSKGYIKNEGSKYTWLSGIFFALGFLMRVSYGIFILPFFAYLLLEDKLKFVLKKDLWIAALLAFIVVLPFFAWLFNVFPTDPLGQFIGAKYGRFSFGQEHGAMGWAGVPQYFGDLVNIMKLPLFILMLAGFLILFIDLFLGFDLILKKEYKPLRIKIFILSWLIIALVVFGLTRSYVEQRDTLPIAVFFFSLVGVALVKLQEYIAKYNKILGFIAVIILLIIGAIPQLTYGYSLTQSKLPSYAPVKEAALWIKQNSKPSDLVYSMSSVQNLYYSERNTYSFSGQTREEFDKAIKKDKPKYIVLSIFEPYWLNQKFDFNDWLKDNPDFIRPVNAWFEDAERQKAVLIIYETNWNVPLNETFIANFSSN
jgi:4-amino-4-deoxy-L-arabinose transferase-like glycosyltransferase